MAVAVHDRDLYFFGGVGAAGTESIYDVSADLWKFNTHDLSWENIEFSDPWPRPRRCVGFADYHGHLMLWGGSGIVANGTDKVRYNFLNDLWTFNPQAKQWKQLAETEDHLLTPQVIDRPFPRYTPVFQSLQERLFLFGGYTEDRLGKRKLNDAWLLEDGMWHEVPMNGRSGYALDCNWPGLRYGCMSATDKNIVFVCGGFADDGDHIDLWSFDPTVSSWAMLAPDDTVGAPMPRYSAAFVYHDRKLYLFGGRSRRYPKLNFNDLWVFDLIDGQWSMLSDNRLPHRYDSEATFPGYHAKSSSAVIGDYWYIWGGEGLHGHVSDFWRFDFKSQVWEHISAARHDDPEFW